MRIIKPGKLPDDPHVLSGCCDICGAVVEATFEESEIYASITGYSVCRCACPTVGCDHVINLRFKRPGLPTCS